MIYRIYRWSGIGWDSIGKVGINGDSALVAAKEAAKRFRLTSTETIGVVEEDIAWMSCYRGMTTESIMQKAAKFAVSDII